MKYLVLITLVTFSVVGAAPAFAETPANGEIMSTKTNGMTFKLGDALQLTIEDYNNGTQKNINTIKNTYPGILSPCGISYFDFVFLRGDHTNISTFDDLVAVKDDAINVVYDMLYNTISCPLGYFKSIKDVTLESNSHNATITYVNGNGEIEIKSQLIGIRQIHGVYGKESIRKQIVSNQILEYVENQTLPVGEYTIVAFSMSGKISKPLLIEVTNVANGSDKEVNYANFRNTGSEISFSCDNAGMTSKEACEFQHSVMIGVIGGIVSAVIGVPVVLFRKRK